MRRLDPTVLAGMTALQGAYGIDIDMDPQRAFDAVIHIRDVTAARGCFGLTTAQIHSNRRANQWV